MEYRLKIDGLYKIFGPDAARAVHLLSKGADKNRILSELNMVVGLNDVSLSVPSGAIYMIMGLSGSGKSTLARCINRLHEPSAGRILLDGRDIVQLSEEDLREVRRTRISMVFQHFALLPNKTVLENVEFGLKLRHIPPAERRRRAEEVLAVVGLSSWGYHRPGELSGGMRQRVGLARALATDADVLIMDEAFSALDPLIRKEMQDELVELQASMKKTIIFITHDLDEALRIGDRIALMKDGAVVQVGTPEQILTDPANEYVERFVEDVDLSKVLTASNVMVRAETIAPDRGPRVALQLMRDRGISNLYMVDKGRRLIGAVTAEASAEAVKTGRGLEDILVREVTTVGPDVHLSELFDTVSVAKIPVAVVDDTGRLLGIIIRGAVLAALSGNGDRTGAGDST